MFKSKLLTSAMAAAFVCSGVLAVSSAHAGTTVVTFDDLADGLVPDGYGGITWDSNWQNYSESQDPYNPESPPSRVYTNYSLWSGGSFDAVPFYFSSPIVFDGAYFAGGYYEGVTFELFDGPTQVWTSATLDQSATPTFLASGYSGLVTSVQVAGYNGYYVMDNVTYSTAVPEAGTWAMMLAGFAGLAGGALMRRRHDRSASVFA